MFVFRAMPQDSATAMVAGGRERVNSAFEAIENMSYAGKGDMKCFVVVVAANFTSFHDVLRVGLKKVRGENAVVEEPPFWTSVCHQVRLPAAPRTLRTVRDSRLSTTT